jgi:Fe-S cluster assembly iron-binding protein IscA
MYNLSFSVNQLKLDIRMMNEQIKKEIQKSLTKYVNNNPNKNEILRVIIKQNGNTKTSYEMRLMDAPLWIVKNIVVL